MATRSDLLSLTPKNIIVRMPNWLGDLVMATPILTDLRNHWPEAKITVMCQGALSAVIQEDPHINKIISFKRPNNWFNKKTRKEIFLPLREEPYDLGVLLTNSLSSAWLFYNGHVQNRIGYHTHFRKWLLNHPVPFPLQRKTQHLVMTYKMLLKSLGIPLSSTAPQLYLTKQEQQEAHDYLATLGNQSHDVLIGINPGAAYGSAKCWLPERFKELTRRLLNNSQVKILYFGDKAGAPLVHDICKEFPERVINLAGKTTLRQLMALMQICRVFLTNDSGPMHVASALNIPLIALFGSTSDSATGPYNGGHVIHKRVPCSPCYRRECPIDFRCMKSITVEEVYQSIQYMLRETELINIK